MIVYSASNLIGEQYIAFINVREIAYERLNWIGWEDFGQNRDKWKSKSAFIYKFGAKYEHWNVIGVEDFGQKLV